MKLRMAKGGRANMKLENRKKEKRHHQECSFSHENLKSNVLVEWGRVRFRCTLIAVGPLPVIVLNKSVWVVFDTPLVENVSSLHQGFRPSRTLLSFWTRHWKNPTFFSSSFAKANSMTADPSWSTCWKVHSCWCFLLRAKHNLDRMLTI